MPNEFDLQGKGGSPPGRLLPKVSLREPEGTCKRDAPRLFSDQPAPLPPDKSPRISHSG